MSRRSKVQREWTWAELCCLGCAGLQPWRRIFTKKWFNISSPESDFSADEVDASESESESEEECDSASRFLNEDRGCELPQEIDANCIEGIPCELYRQKSETLHAKHKTKKELRICVGTWNVGGRLPSDDLSIDAWLEMEEAADIYVLGFQEIVPLNAENVLGAEDSWPVERWEYIIRETLNKTQPVKAKHKCSCSLPSPSSSKPSDGNLVVEDHVLPNPDCESYKDIQPDGQSLHFPFNENQNNANGDDPTSNLAFQTIVIADQYRQQEQHADQQSFINMFDSSGNFSLKNNEISLEACTSQQKILSDTISSPKRISLLWTEQSSEMLDQRSMVTEDTKPLNQVKSIEVSTSYTSANGDNNDSSDPYITCEVDLETINRKKKSSFARIISKQMVGILLSIWVRTSLRKHIQNVKISTVGVGLLGYMGNKGSISVSMSIYQTFFCFVCCHLTSGEKDGDELRRNTDVQEIHRRTLFGSDASLGMPRTIFDHETIIWLGDLNYRINLSYDRIHDLISRKEWRKLFEKDQLKLQLKEGGTFHGWSEGEVNFPPTYKYEFNSEKYTADDPKGRRTPAWCDRILSFGKGMRLLEYKRAELLHSDHRPVTAIFAAEVEVRRALTSADTEVEEYVVSEA